MISFLIFFVLENVYVFDFDLNKPILRFKKNNAI